MNSFYQKALEDAVLGPFFSVELGDDIRDHEWVAHVELLADFWLAKLLGENTYVGNFVGAHVKMPIISKESVGIWLTIFSATVDEVYEVEVATFFKKRTQQLVKEFLNSKKKI